MSLLLRISFFFTAFALALSANGSAAKTHFQTGIKAYENGDDEAAATAFTMAVQAEETSAARHNLGLTYLQLDQSAQAVWQLERALLLDPFNRSYREKLNRIRNQLGLSPGAQKWYIQLSQIVTFKLWVRVATLSFWLLLALLILPRLNQRKAGSRIKLLSLLSSLILVLSLTAIWLNLKTLKSGTVLSEEIIALHAAPATAAPESGFARPGERAHVIDQHNDFYKIKTEGAATGWLSKTDFYPLAD